jgi:hypothetical protein
VKAQRKGLLIAALAISCLRASSAQTFVATCSAPSTLPMTTGRGRPVVTGEPYSGLQRSRHTQTLADGTVIDQDESRTRFYRDSAGRTRAETILLADPASGSVESVSSIWITDPVVAVSYLLQPYAKLARQLPSQPFGTFQSGPYAIGIVPAPASPGTTSTSSDGSANVVPGPKPAPPVLKPEFEDLGTKTMEGLLATGRRTTRTIPTNQVGNDRPITIVQETWCSEELHLNILTKVSDPRSGEHITQLTEISRSEPDPSLFQVPPDYTIQNEEFPSAH